MLKNLTCCGFLLVAGGAAGQARPVPGLQPYQRNNTTSLLPSLAAPAATRPMRLPGSHNPFEARYPLVQPLAGTPLASIRTLPDNRLVYYRLNSPVATGASLAGAVAGWLLGIDPQVQAYQQCRQFKGRDNVLSVPRQIRPDDLLR